jgi:hypothetical protein
MTNPETIFLYFFVLSILTTIRIVIKFISALLQNPPQRIELSGRELILYGAMVSYLITYIITNI